jgi:D-tyrosyl-tRNA(Tyr) deacylase
VIALLQRVSRAHVTVADELTGEIERGLLVLLGVAKGDESAAAARLAEKTAKYRCFASEDGSKPMHHSLLDLGLGALVVSQFTLCANTRKGLRPGFDDAAEPELAERLYEEYCAGLQAAGVAPVARGRFRAHMQVELVNDGPVTLELRS